MQSRRLAVGLTTSYLIAFCVAGHAAPDNCAPPAGGFVAVEGKVEVAADAASGWRPASLDTALCEGDSVRVGPDSRAAVRLANDAVLRLDQNTTLRLVDVSAEPQERSVLDLVVGAFKSFSRAPRTMTVNTPYVNGMIEGTEFAMRVAAADASVQVFEGKVRATNAHGEAVLMPGQRAQSDGQAAPLAETLVRPDDAVQWTLYYPSLSTPDAPASGDAAGTAGDDSPTALVARAEHLLAVGRAEEARTLLAPLLAATPPVADALALRAVMQVVQNDRAAALADATQAHAQSPGTRTALALSYAQQAAFQLGAARETVRQATAHADNDALLFTRLAELELMHGDHDAAAAAVARAAALAPDLPYVARVRGFVTLAANDTVAAMAAFSGARELDAADPLAHFGLGLTLIRRGQLADGRREIEAAVALDGSNALLRPYLGKAYYEEKRMPLDGQQYAIARRLDPADPTPWFYAAIAAQTENRPVDALHDVQEAIDRNDRRAVYRSRQLLDSDLAARGASLGRVYGDLGFQPRALVEGWHSVNLDPASFSAHRFLADSYGALPRHEIARVSELFQAQMLQPLNTTPIQPRLAEKDLFLVSSGGPGALAYNEFNPVFTRDGLRYQGNSTIGEHNTYAGEGVLSGVFDRASFSVGGMHFTTDGFRPNADQRDDIADVFLQFALTPDTSVQAEYRYRNYEHGDLAMRFFDDNYSPGERNREERNSYRIGVRHDFSPRATLLGSFTYQEADFSLRDAAPKEGPPLFLIGLQRPDRAYGGEWQYLFRGERFNVVSGFGYFNIDSRIDSQVGIDFAPPRMIIPGTTDTDARHVNGYAYANWQPFSRVTLSVGGSGDFLDSDSPELGSRDQFNPKAGLTFEPWDGTVLRAAGFRTLKRTLVTDQTLEPTQVAGFNQFFDDINGTAAWRYGAAVDQRFTRDLLGGIEVTKGDLDVPYLDFSGNAPVPGRVAWQESIGRVYLLWTPQSWLALRAGYHYERALRSNLLADGVVSMDSQRVPFGFSVFLPHGFSGAVNATYVHQHGLFERIEGTLQSGASDFAVLDLSASYRLPRRFGMLSVGVTNLFDKRFEYFDTDRNNPLLQPARTVFGRVTLAFP